jgi:hypothetical protein
VTHSNPTQSLAAREQMRHHNHHETWYRDLSAAEQREVAICGVGALGANLAESLARMGVGQLMIIDFDRVEVHNLSTQPWSEQDIGSFKVRALASSLYRATRARVQVVEGRLTAENASGMLQGADVIVDCFDNVASRRALQDYASAANLPILHLALGGDGQYGCGVWGSAYHIPETEVGIDGCDYPLSRPLAQLVAGMGAEIVTRHLLSGEQQSFELTFGDFHVRTWP